MRKIIIHGYKEFYAISRPVKIFKNNHSDFIGKVSRNSTIIVEAEDGDILIFKYGSREEAVRVESNTTDLFLRTNRWTGGFNVINKQNGETFNDGHRKNKGYKTVLVIFGVIGVFVLAMTYLENSSRHKVPPYTPIDPLKEIQGYEDFPQPSSNQKEDQEMEICHNCKGAKSIPKGPGISNKYGSTTCPTKYYGNGDTHVCKISQCKICWRSHCEDLDVHAPCPSCSGKGETPIPAYRR